MWGRVCEGVRAASTLTPPAPHTWADVWKRAAPSQSIPCRRDRVRCCPSRAKASAHLAWLSNDDCTCCASRPASPKQPVSFTHTAQYAHNDLSPGADCRAASRPGRHPAHTHRVCTPALPPDPFSAYLGQASTRVVVGLLVPYGSHLGHRDAAHPGPRLRGGARGGCVAWLLGGGETRHGGCTRWWRRQGGL